MHVFGRQVQDWEADAASFGLAWWLAVAPSVTRWLWPKLFLSAVPGPVDALLKLCWLGILLGLVASLGALSSDFAHLKRLQRTAAWFIVGVASLPVLLAVVGAF